MTRFLLVLVLLLSIEWAYAQRELNGDALEFDSIKKDSLVVYTFAVPAFAPPPSPTPSTGSGAPNVTIQLYRVDANGRRTYETIGKEATQFIVRGPNNFEAKGTGELILPSSVPGSYSLDVLAPLFDYSYAVRYCLGNCLRICPLNATTNEFCQGNGGCAIKAGRCLCDVGVAFAIRGGDCGSVTSPWVNPTSIHIVFLSLVGIPTLAFFLIVTIVCYTNTCDGCLRRSDYDPETMRLTKEE